MVDRFKEVVDDVIFSLKEKKELVANNKNEFLVGDILIRKNNGLYTLMLNNFVLYDEINLIETAVSLAKLHGTGKTILINKLLELDKKYKKNFMDAMYHKEAFLSAKNEGDIEIMDIKETLFEQTMSVASYARKEIHQIYIRLM